MVKTAQPLPNRNQWKCCNKNHSKWRTSSRIFTIHNKGSWTRWNNSSPNSKRSMRCCRNSMRSWLTNHGQNTTTVRWTLATQTSISQWHLRQEWTCLWRKLPKWMISNKDFWKITRKWRLRSTAWRRKDIDCRVKFRSWELRLKLQVCRHRRVI